MGIKTLRDASKHEITGGSMPSKRDGAGERLRALVDEERRRREAEHIFDNFPVGMLAADPILYRARVLSNALHLRPGETALAKAFEYFELDPQKPEHWHFLINYLSRSHFETKPAGRRREWTAERYFQLLRDLYLATHKVPDVKSRSWFRKVRQLMIDDPAFGERYSHMKQDALAKQIDNMFALFNHGTPKGNGAT